MAATIIYTLRPLIRYDGFRRDMAANLTSGGIKGYEQEVGRHTSAPADGQGIKKRQP